MQTALKAAFRAHDLAEHGRQKHQVHELGIELGASAFEDDSLSFVRRPAVPIASAVRDDVERVRERDDTRGERDPVPPEAARISSSVPALMVRKHCLGQLGVKVPDRTQYLRASNRVRADGAALGWSQLAGLVHHIEERLVDLSNVMEQRGELDRASDTLVHSARIRDGEGVGGNATNVCPGLRIICVDGAQERLEGGGGKPLSSMAPAALIDENPAERDAGRDQNRSNHGHNKGKN